MSMARYSARAAASSVRADFPTAARDHERQQPPSPPGDCLLHPLFDQYAPGGNTSVEGMGHAQRCSL